MSDQDVAKAVDQLRLDLWRMFELWLQLQGYRITHDPVTNVITGVTRLSAEER